MAAWCRQGEAANGFSPAPGIPARQSERLPNYSSHLKAKIQPEPRPDSGLVNDYRVRQIMTLTAWRQEFLAGAH